MVSVVWLCTCFYCTGNPSYLSHLARPLHLRLRLCSCAGEWEFGWRAAAMSMAPNIFATALTAEPTVGTGFKAVKRGTAGGRWRRGSGLPGLATQSPAQQPNNLLLVASLLRGIAAAFWRSPTVPSRLLANFDGAWWLRSGHKHGQLRCCAAVQNCMAIAKCSGSALARVLTGFDALSRCLVAA